MANPQVVIVTGSNRGVGGDIVSLLVKQSLQRPLIIYATSRSGKATDLQPSGHHSIISASLDITSQSSITAFFALLKSNAHTATALINNAAVSYDRETVGYAVETLRVNYYGTRDMCMAFLAQPQLPDNARIVNLTSGLNVLSTYSTALQARFRAARSIADMDGLASSYIDAMSAEERESWGMGKPSYHVSKALINTLTIVLARLYPEVAVNCCCPGWTDTQMGKQGKGEPPKSVEEGAMTAVRCAVGVLGEDGDLDGGVGRQGERVSGMFFENERIVEVGWGRGVKWLDT